MRKMENVNIATPKIIRPEAFQGCMAMKDIELPENIDMTSGPRINGLGEITFPDIIIPVVPDYSQDNN